MAPARGPEGTEADELVDEEWSAQTAEIESELDTVRDKVQKIIRKYQPRVRTLNIKLEQELRPA